MAAASPTKSSFLPMSVRFAIPERKPGYPWMELYCSLVAALSFLCSGVVQSYTSGAIYSLQNDEASHIPLTKLDISWIASMPALASLFGTLLIGPIMESLGRKKTITLIALPFILGWLIIGTAVNLGMILVGRFCTGFAIGLARACAPVYVSETARAKHRGKLGYLPPIMSAVGVLLGCTIGSNLHWKITALLMISLPVVLVLTSLWLPESPHWLIKRNQEDLAFLSLKSLRHRAGVPSQDEDQGIYKEIHEIRESLEELSTSSDDEQKKGLISLLKERSIRVRAMMVFCLMIFQQFSGVSAVVYYLKMILNHGLTLSGPVPRSAHSNYDMRPTIVGSVHIIAFFISLPLVDRVGRKFLLKVSGFLMALSHIVLAIYLYNYEPTDTSASAPNIMSAPSNSSQTIMMMGSNETILSHPSFPTPDGEALSWLPLVCLCAYIASFSFASPIPFILMSEIFGISVRSYLCSATTLLGSIASYIIVQMFPILMYHVSPAFTFGLFAFFSVLNSVLGFIIPETKGKTLAQIENLFRAPRDFRGRLKDTVEVPDCVQVSVVGSQNNSKSGGKLYQNGGMNIDNADGWSNYYENKPSASPYGSFQPSTTMTTSESSLSTANGTYGALGIRKLGETQKF